MIIHRKSAGKKPFNSLFKIMTRLSHRQYDASSARFVIDTDPLYIV